MEAISSCTWVGDKDCVLFTSDGGNDDETGGCHADSCCRKLQANMLSRYESLELMLYLLPLRACMYSGKLLLCNYQAQCTIANSMAATLRG